MTDYDMIQAMQQMLFFVMVGVCIVSIPILVVSVIMSIVQAATQINEMTLTFIPKFLTMFILLFMISPWLIEKLIQITHFYLDNLPYFIR